MSRPLNSFLGGLGLALPVHSLLLLNGTVFGISGFLHRAFRGSREAIASALGLLLGGVFVGLKEGRGPPPFLVSSLPPVILSGLLVGVGTKMANGCTSGHMIAGISRFSARSVAATAIFLTTGVLTTQFLHGTSLHPSASVLDWSLDTTGQALLTLQMVPLIISAFLYVLTSRRTNDQPTSSTPAFPTLRLVASLVTGVQFALALRLSNLTEPAKVTSFLLLPAHAAFDPSLAFLAAGALPAAIALYHFARGSERPRLGGPWSVPKGGKIDQRLVVGAALFGIGWGLTGFCPGPGIINLGRALGGRSDPLPTLMWLASVVAGGFMV